MSMRSAGTAGPSLVSAAIEDGLRVMAARTAAGLMALFASLAWLSLASWSVHDLARQSGDAELLRNLLGWPGARFSDLLLQSLGAGSVLIVVAPLFWAVELWSKRKISRFPRKLLFWPVSAILFAAALAVVPPLGMWPLQQGLGGLLGDMLFSLVSQLAALLHPALGWPLALAIFLLFGSLALLQALGLRLADLALLTGGREPAIGYDEPGDEITYPEPRFEAHLGHDGGQYPSLEGAAIGETSWSRGGAEPYPAHATHPHATNPAVDQSPGAHHARTRRHADMAAQDRPERLGERLRQAAASWRINAHLPSDHGPAPDPRQVRPQPTHRHRQALPPYEVVPQIETSELPVDHDSRAIAERFAPGAAGRKQSARPGNGRNPAGRGGPASVSTAATEPADMRPGAGATVLDPANTGVQQSPNSNYRRPSLRLLKEPPISKIGKGEFNQSVLRGNSRLLEDVLADFGVKGKIINVRPGPIITLFELEPARGVKAARVIGLGEDIARSMSAVSARVSVVPGRNVLGIELPNMQRDTVYLRDLLSAPAFQNSAATLPLALGKSIEGEPIIVDLARMPHLLIAGTTGSGKSVGINAMILSLLYRHGPEDCRLILIDPKMLEFMPYNNIPHLLTPVVTEPAKAVAALDWAVREMEERYKRMATLGVRNISVFNNQIRNAKRLGKPIVRTVQTGFDAETGQPVVERQQLALETMPYIVIVIDEMADLMLTAGKEIEASVQRLAQMARAAGIHLITATQRPSVDVITGTIKANLPSRISYKVTSKIDSRTILGDGGAEHLLGSGDLIYSIDNGRMLRAHGPFVSEDEVEGVTRFLISTGRPAYVEGVTDAPATAADNAAGGSDDASSQDLFDKAVAVILRDQKVSTSYIQRRLSIGYNRAADIVEKMERDGLVSAPDRTGRRQILVGTAA